MLLGEGHNRPGSVGPGRLTCVGQQHQREQSSDLSLARQQTVQQTREPDGLGGQIDPVQRWPRASRVPFVEDEVEYVQDHTEPLSQLGRELEASPGASDALLGPADALRHRGLGNQECGCDLRGRQTPNGTKGERELRGGRQRGMAAQEEQGERLVLVGGPMVNALLIGGKLECHHGLLAVPPRTLAAPLVNQRPTGYSQQPRTWMVWHPLGRPLHCRRKQCLLDGVLALGELPVLAHQRAEDLRREFAQQVLDPGPGVHSSGASSMIRRTSIGYSMNATTWDAISTARSSLTSTIQ